MLRVVWVFDGNVTPADVIAKAIQPRSFRENQLLNFFRLFQTAVGDVYRQSHDSMDIVRPRAVEGKKKRIELKAAAANENISAASLARS